MENTQGLPQFCDGCPMAGRAKGPLKKGIAHDDAERVVTMGMSFVEVDREVTLIDTYGGKSKTFLGMPESFTKRGDFVNLLQEVHKCDGPVVRSREVWKIWPFWKATTVSWYVCGAQDSRSRQDG